MGTLKVRSLFSPSDNFMLRMHRQDMHRLNLLKITWLALQHTDYLVPQAWTQGAGG